jgi:hypothetical protein
LGEAVSGPSFKIPKGSIITFIRPGGIPISGINYQTLKSRTQVNEPELKFMDIDFSNGPKWFMHRFQDIIKIMSEWSDLSTGGSARQREQAFVYPNKQTDIMNMRALFVIKAIALFDHFKRKQVDVFPVRKDKKITDRLKLVVFGDPNIFNQMSKLIYGKMDFQVYESFETFEKDFKEQRDQFDDIIIFVCDAGSRGFGNIIFNQLATDKNSIIFKLRSKA